MSVVPIGTVVCGDNCETMRHWPTQSIDLVVTSPPYGSLRTYGGHSWDFFGVAWNLKRLLKPGGVLTWIVADETKDGNESGASMEQAIHFKRMGLNLYDTMIYASDKPPLTHRRYEQAWEFVFVFSAGKPSRWNPLTREAKQPGRIHSNSGGSFIKSPGGDYEKRFHNNPVPDRVLRNNVWWYATGNERYGHPAPFPIALATDLILTWSNPGDIILDPFAGSGTALKAAQNLDRLWVGVETNPQYVQTCGTRLGITIGDDKM